MKLWQHTMTQFFSKGYVLDKNKGPNSTHDVKKIKKSWFFWETIKKCLIPTPKNTNFNWFSVDFLFEINKNIENHTT